MARATKEWGGEHRLWIKRDDLTGSLLSGNKVRKLEFIAAHALDNGYDTLITCGGLQSNHCRATALVGAQLGLKVHLILRGEQPTEKDGNYLLDYLAGARVDCFSARDYFKNLDTLFQELCDNYAAQGHKALPIPTGGSDGIGVWGYIAACEELNADFASCGIPGAHIVTASGSGGTQAGLTLGSVLHELPATVWGVNVCDDEQYFLDKVAHDVSDWQSRYPGVPHCNLQPRVIDGYVGPGYGIAEPEIFDLIVQLTRLEGIVLDPVYTAKAFHGMVNEIGKGTFAGVQDIVFMHTGGTFGIFPQRDGFR
jgi:D-cysteine desulfhydrase